VNSATTSSSQRGLALGWPGAGLDPQAGGRSGARSTTCPPASGPNATLEPSGPDWTSTQLADHDAVAAAINDPNYRGKLMEQWNEALRLNVPILKDDTLQESGSQGLSCLIFPRRAD
jgi:hypothetical protein